MSSVRSWVAAWLALLLSAAALSAAETTPTPVGKTPSERFLRVTRDENKKPLALETPIVHYVPTDGGRQSPTVDLIAAIHIAEKSYYEQLNREFDNYDAVLYELVAPKGASVPQPKDSGGSHPISLLQNGMKDLLGLEYQLKVIDYTRKNMIHADMSPDQFAESMRSRGESTMTILARMLGYAWTRQGEASDGPSDGQMLLALFDKNRTVAMKRILAEQFASGDDYMAALEGPTGSTLVSGRNQVALQTLQKEIDLGKRKIAIFYGAAHMPDLQSRLRKEFGLSPAGVRWLVAWNLKP
jgi:hypothetical protein